jgi:Cd2+/Zn2+-exporting ATPase
VSGGYYFGREALQELIYERRVGIELLMSTAAVVAIVMGQAAEGAMLAFLYSISEAAEGYTEEKTRSAIRALMDLTPKSALVRRNGGEETIPVEALCVGDVFIVKPGQSMATDGEVVAGESTVNQAPVTGESVPVYKHIGDPVFAGSLNEEGALEVKATRTFADNTVSRIIHMVEEAQEQKGRSQRFIERFGARYSPAVLLAGILFAIIPGAVTGSWVEWVERATVFVVAAAPCALVISIPITLVATLGTGARTGVLIKGGVYVEELAKVRIVALDKTGTLTRGEPEVTTVVPHPGAAGPTAEESASTCTRHRGLCEHARFVRAGLDCVPVDHGRWGIGTRGRSRGVRRQPGAICGSARCAARRICRSDHPPPGAGQHRDRSRRRASRVRGHRGPRQSAAERTSRH